MARKHPTRERSSESRQGRRGLRALPAPPKSAAIPRTVGRPGWTSRRRGVKIWTAVLGIAALLVMSVVVWLVKQSAAPLPGTVYPSQGNTHINPGDSHPEYNSVPPTSGWHYLVPPQRGIYMTALPEELLVHFMEHAGVVVHYNPDVLPPGEQQQLHDIVASELKKGQGLVLMAPDPLAPQAVALTAWQRLQTYSNVTGNKGKIQDFIERLQCNYDPESICGPAHGTSFQATGTPGPGVPTVIGPPIPANVPLQSAPMR